MKVLVLLLLGIALGSAVTPRGTAWRPETTYKYHYVGKVQTGMPELNKVAATMTMKAQVAVEVQTPHLLLVKLSDVDFSHDYDDFPYRWSKEELYRPSSLWDIEKPNNTKSYFENEREYTSVPDRITKEILTTPVRVHMKSGVVTAVDFQENEPLYSSNIKKGIISMLQLNVTADCWNVVDSVDTTLLYTEEKPVSHYSTMETSVGGICNTIYDVTPLPEYLQNEPEVNDPDYLLPGGVALRVTKTKDYSNCKRRVAVSYASPSVLKCDPSSDRCGKFTSRSSVSSYTLRGDRSGYYISKVSTHGDIMMSPLVINDKKSVVTSNQTLQLIQVVKSTPTHKFQTDVKSHSLEYLVPNEYERVKDVGNRLYKPSLWDRPAHLAFATEYNITGHQVVDNIVQTLVTVTKTLNNSTKLSDKDIVNKLLQVKHTMKHLNYKDIERVYERLNRETVREEVRPLFYDTLLMAGTNPAIMFLKNQIINNELSGHHAVHIIEFLPSVVVTPTDEIVQELVQLIRSDVVQNDRRLRHVSPVVIANLIRQACVDWNRWEKRETHSFNYAVNVYDPTVFCNITSPVVKEYVSWLTARLETVEKEDEQLVYIKALGETGHKDAIKALKVYISGKADVFAKKTMKESVTLRMVALHSLKPTANIYPEEVRRVTLPIFMSYGEDPILRSTALETLLRTNPPLSIIQKIALSTWTEPSKMVISHVFTSFRSAVNTTIPSLMPIAKKAEHALKLTRPINNPLHYSQYHRLETSSVKNNASARIHFTSIGNSESLIPRFLHSHLHVDLGSMATDVFDISGNFEGVQTVINDILEQGGIPTYEENQPMFSHKRTSRIPKLTDMKETLNISRREVDNFFFNFQSRVMDSVSHFATYDKSFINYIGNLFTNNKEQSYNINVKRVFPLLDTTVMLPTEVGIPAVMLFNVPIIVSSSGEVHVSVTPSTTDNGQKLVPSEVQIQSRMKPAIISAVDGRIGFVSPVNSLFMYSGVQKNVTVHTPLISTVVYDKESRNVSYSIKPATDYTTELLVVETSPFIETARITENGGDLTTRRTIFGHDHIKSSEYKTQLFGLKLRVDQHGDRLLHSVKEPNPYSIYRDLVDFTPKHLLSVRHYRMRVMFEPQQSETSTVRGYVHTSFCKDERRDCQNLITEPAMCFLSVPGKPGVDQCCGTCRQVLLKNTRNTQTFGSSFRPHSPTCKDAREDCSKAYKYQKFCSKRFDECCETCTQVYEEKMRNERPVVKSRFSRQVITSEAIDEFYSAHFEAGIQTIGTPDYERSPLRPRPYPIHASNIEGYITRDYYTNLLYTQQPTNEDRIKQSVEFEFHRSPTPTTEEWSLCSNFHTEMPLVRNHESWRNVLQEDLTTSIIGDVSVGENCEKRILRAEGTIKRSPYLQSYIPETYLVRECKRLEKKGLEQYPACDAARVYASALNELFVKFDGSLMSEVGEYRSRELERYVEYFFWPYVSREYQTNSEVQPKHVFVHATVHPNGQRLNVTLRQPRQTTYFSTVPVHTVFRPVLPVTVASSPIKKILHMTFDSEHEPTCVIQSQRVLTYDNVTVHYEPNSCWTAVTKDCSEQVPIAVLVKKPTENKKAIKVIYYNDEVEVQANPNKIEYISINDQEQEIPVGEHYYHLSNNVRVDKVREHHVIVRVPGAEVHLIGDAVVLKMSAKFRNRMCGLCGDMNSEVTADLLTPEKCVTQKHHIFGESYIIPDGRCPSPSEKTIQERRLVCMKKESLWRPNNGCFVPRTKIVEKDNKKCFSLRPVVSCAPECEENVHKYGRRSEEKQNVEFFCVENRETSRTMERQVLSGQVLDIVKRVNPNYYIDVHVPTECVRRY